MRPGWAQLERLHGASTLWAPTVRGKQLRCNYIIWDVIILFLPCLYFVCYILLDFSVLEGLWGAGLQTDVLLQQSLAAGWLETACVASALLEDHITTLDL